MVIMSTISEKVNSLLSVYTQVSTTIATDRKNRSELIHVIGTLYTQKTRRCPTLDKKYFPNGLSDMYLKTAENVVYRKVLSEFPCSYARVKPLADEYLSQWSQFLKALASPMDEKILDEKVYAFVRAHLNFSRRYLTEYSATHGDSRLAVELKFPETLKLFYHFTSTFIARNPSLGAQIKLLIETSDAKIFLALPYLVVLQMIQCPDCSCPELLKPLETKINTLRDCYNQLDLNEKTSLEAELLNENATFSANAKAVHLQLSEIAYSLQAKENAQPFTRCFNTLLMELNEDFATAETLRPHLEPTISSCDMALNTVGGAIYALLSLPLESDALFVKLMPTWKQGAPFHDKFLRGSPEFRNEVKDHLKDGTRIDSDPDFMKIADVALDLSREGKHYRLLGILQQAFPDIAK
jgi:hypothetical protein